MNTEILQPTTENIAACAAVIAGGGVVAFPTETVYGLGADAYNESAVKKIFEAKGRPSDNPLIVHLYSFDQIGSVAENITPLAEKLMYKFMPGALTLVLKKKSGLPDAVTAGLKTVGVRIPSHPVCREFLRACNCPVCAPSANTSTLPSPTKAAHVYADLKGKIRYVLDGGDCDIGVESTVLDLSGEKPRLLRLGGVSREMLEEECGFKIETVTGSSVALCPGMKYKHYSPKAEVLFSAYYENMCGGICEQYDNVEASGGNPVIICMDKNLSKYESRRTYNAGRTYEDYAHNLFALLRKADEDKFGVVIAEGVPSDGIGAAIINRLIKSSGGRII